MHGLSVVEGDYVSVKEAEHGSAKAGEKVALVSAEDVASQRYSPYDVVLLVPGLDDIHSDHCMVHLYRSIFAEDGVSGDTDDF